MRIGLIAVSGVRAVDEELTRLGLTLPGFIERGKVIASLPSLGRLTLAGMTPSRHEHGGRTRPSSSPRPTTGATSSSPQLC